MPVMLSGAGRRGHYRDIHTQFSYMISFRNAEKRASKAQLWMMERWKSKAYMTYVRLTQYMPCTTVRTADWLGGGGLYIWCHGPLPIGFLTHCEVCTASSFASEHAGSPPPIHIRSKLK